MRCRWPTRSTRARTCTPGWTWPARRGTARFVEHWLQQERLPARRVLRECSAGQRRRLASAPLQLAPRPLWLLDEPFDALDRAACERLAVRAQAHLAAGGALLLSSHGALPQGFPACGSSSIWPRPEARHRGRTVRRRAAGRAPLRATVRRELRLALRQPAELLWHAGFFVMVAALFPLSLQPEGATLRLLGPGVLGWRRCWRCWPAGGSSTTTCAAAGSTSACWPEPTTARLWRCW